MLLMSCVVILSCFEVIISFKRILSLHKGLVLDYHASKRFHLYRALSKANELVAQH